MNVTAIATAALTGLGSVAPGVLEIPVGIAETRFTDPDYCDDPIKFYPTGNYDGCGGWTTFDKNPANASTLRGILDGMEDGSYTAPGYDVGQEVEFVGGNVASALPDLRDLYNLRKDADGNWETTVIVYEAYDCSNPSGPIRVDGFANVVITNVLAPPDGQLIEAVVDCENYVDGRGGGSDFGTVGTIPALVQ